MMEMRMADEKKNNLMKNCMLTVDAGVENEPALQMLI
jgi:hypothetical protein